jgi:hypothetical protein
MDKHSAAPVKHSMSGTGECKLCGRPVSSKPDGIYRHVTLNFPGFPPVQGVGPVIVYRCKREGY